MKDQHDPIRDAIAAELDRTGLTIMQLAREVGIARSTLSSYLHGRRALPYATLLAVLDRLGLSVARGIGSTTSPK